MRANLRQNYCAQTCAEMRNTKIASILRDFFDSISQCIAIGREKVTTVTLGVSGCLTAGYGWHPLNANRRKLRASSFTDHRIDGAISIGRERKVSATPPTKSVYVLPGPVICYIFCCYLCCYQLLSILCSGSYPVLKNFFFVKYIFLFLNFLTISTISDIVKRCRGYFATETAKVNLRTALQTSFE